jgi:hypothetical protein
MVAIKNAAIRYPSGVTIEGDAVTTAPVYDESCIVPIVDTWRNWDRAGTWVWTLRNAWSADQLGAVLDVLRPFARVSAAILGSSPDAPPLTTPEFAWDSIAHAAFEQVLVGAVRAATVPVTTIDLALDLRVWIRTATSRTMPVRGWVHHAAEARCTSTRRTPRVRSASTIRCSWTATLRGIETPICIA